MKFFEDSRNSQPEEHKQMVKVIKCNSLDNRYQITDCLRKNMIVVFNTDNMHKMDAMLMCEFISGFVHANHGVYQEITEHNFMVTPEGFEISEMNPETHEDQDDSTPLDVPIDNNQSQSMDNVE